MDSWRGRLWEQTESFYRLIWQVAWVLFCCLVGIPDMPPMKRILLKTTPLIKTIKARRPPITIYALPEVFFALSHIQIEMSFFRLFTAFWRVQKIVAFYQNFTLLWILENTAIASAALIFGCTVSHLTRSSLLNPSSFKSKADASGWQEWSFWRCALHWQYSLWAFPFPFTPSSISVPNTVMSVFKTPRISTWWLKKHKTAMCICFASFQAEVMSCAIALKNWTQGYKKIFQKFLNGQNYTHALSTRQNLKVLKCKSAIFFLELEKWEGVWENEAATRDRHDVPVFDNINGCIPVVSNDVYPVTF